MASLESFATLAGNHEPHSGSAARPRYIRRSSDSGPSPYGHEASYNQYMDIVEGVWGTGAPFEAHAAATELYLCSTPETRGRPFTSHSECADNFFASTFAQVEPKAVITVGRAPREYMRREYATSPVTSNTPSPYRARVGEGATWVFDIPHSGARASGDSRIRAIRHAIDGLCDMVHHGRDPRQVPLAELLVNGGSQQAADSLEVDEARRRLAAGEPYSDGRVYPPAYRPEARKPRLPLRRLPRRLGSSPGSGLQPARRGHPHGEVRQRIPLLDHASPATVIRPGFTSPTQRSIMRLPSRTRRCAGKLVRRPPGERL